MLNDSEESELWKLHYDYEHIGLTGYGYTRMKNLEKKNKEAS